MAYPYIKRLRPALSSEFSSMAGKPQALSREFTLEKKGDQQGALEEYRAVYMLDPKDATYKQAYELLLQRMNKR